MEEKATLNPPAQHRLDKTDWGSMSDAQRIKHLEIEGFVVLPEILSKDQVKAIKKELAALPTIGTDYSENQRSCKDVQWTNSPACIDLIALPAMVKFLEKLFGDEVLCTSCVYALSRPGHPGIAIHTDAQPYGSQIFGMQASSPRLVRVLYYLDDLTPERSPLKVIPHSHLSLHVDANPYNRYLSHPEEVMVTCKAGSAAIINQTIFHANFPNESKEDRELLAIAYRPAWAGPIAEIPDWPADKVANLPAHVRPLFKSLNTRKIDFNVANRPANMATSAPGINPSRWDG
ncbi:MAG: phytanoyl-CoA dioxygenase family protein [Chitinophagaceae bacterium]|nr:phytanoyl-CoA dioxygenase family protein [Chitinophagaceae bacterium]